MLDAASDLKMPAQPPRMGAGAGVQMRYDSTRHSNMVTSCPAATGPSWLGRHAPDTDAFRGEEGGQGRARLGHGRAGRHTLPSARALGWHQCSPVPKGHPGWCLGAVWVPVPPWLSTGDPCPEPGEPGCWKPREPLQLPRAPALIHPEQGDLPSSVPPSSTTPL